MYLIDLSLGLIWSVWAAYLTRFPPPEILENCDPMDLEEMELARSLWPDGLRPFSSMTGTAVEPRCWLSRTDGTTVVVEPSFPGSSWEDISFKKIVVNQFRLFQQPCEQTQTTGKYFFSPSLIIRFQIYSKISWFFTSFFFHGLVFQTFDRSSNQAQPPGQNETWRRRRRKLTRS